MIISKEGALAVLRTYVPEGDVDKDMLRRMLDFVETRPKSWGKEIVEGHLTGSALVVNADHTKVLFVHHKKFNKWLQPGGHVDDDDPEISYAALREAREETGLTSFKLVSPVPFDLDIHPIPETPKAKEHYHYDVRFLLEADENEPIVCSHESNDVKWFALAEAKQQATSDSLRRMLSRL